MTRPGEPWETNPPLCEVIGCALSALPYFKPDAEGIPCKCGKKHRVCSTHFMRTVRLGGVYLQAYGYVNGVYTQLICPNEVEVALAIVLTGASTE